MKEQADFLMREFFKDYPKWKKHSILVEQYTENIYEEEGINSPFVYNVIVLSGFFHDLGIPIAEKKYAKVEDHVQEKEGEIVAREFMQKMGIRRDILERVCYIIGHHHTYKKIDGIDFQILWEADLIVNTFEGRRDPKNIDIDKNFKTISGRDYFIDIISS